MSPGGSGGGSGGSGGGSGWIFMDFLGFPWISMDSWGERGGHRTGVVEGDLPGLEALSQYPVLGILDTGYRIQGYRKTGYRIAYRIQDYIQLPQPEAPSKEGSADFS